MVLNRISRAFVAAAVAALALAATATVVTSPPAGAAARAVVSSSLTWAVSTNVNTGFTLKPERAALAPATVADAGWTFADGSGSYDPATGELDLSYTGGLEVGNIPYGNYGLQITDLNVAIDASGAGAVTGTVIPRPPADDSVPAGEKGPFSDPITDVTIVTFDAGTPVVSGETTTWTVTPHSVDVTVDPAFEGAQQFPQSLLDALPPSMWAHFQQTSTTNETTNAGKIPAELTFTVTTAPATTTTTTAPATTAPVTTPTTVPVLDEPVEATAGHLAWGIKASFVSYLNTPFAGGAIELNGTTQNDDGQFVYPLAPGSLVSSSTSLTAPFSGDVRMTAHEGELDLTMAEPRVELSGTTGTLTIDARSHNQETGEFDVFDDVVLATLDLTGVQPTADGDQITIANVPATLTAEGAPAFGGFYEGGAELDPVTIVLTVNTDEELPGATEPTISCVPETVTAGEQVRLCAEGFIPGENVQAFIHSDPVLMGVTAADAAGEVDDTFTVPADTAPGVHRFELRGITSGTSILSVEVTVLAADGLGTDPGALARTGSDATTPAAIGVALLAAGAVVTASARRRQQTER